MVADVAFNIDFFSIIPAKNCVFHLCARMDDSSQALTVNNCMDTSTSTNVRIFIIDVGLVQRGYTIPSPVLLKCCVASVVAQSIVLYGTCTGQPAVWGFVSLGSTHCDRVFLFSEVHL